jgi:hypothetical protein
MSGVFSKESRRIEIIGDSAGPNPTSLMDRAGRMRERNTAPSIRRCWTGPLSIDAHAQKGP